MRILMVASECFPLIKTGGLADVVGALPLALETQGADVTVFLPGFPSVLSGLTGKKTIKKLTDVGGGKAKLMSGRTKVGLSVIALDAPHLFKFEGNPYQLESGVDRPDNAIKFAAFSRIAADLASGKFGLKAFDVVHAHDWQAGLVSVYLQATNSEVKAVLTIHNLAFQGLFPKSILTGIGLPDEVFHKDGLEYWDKVSFLKGGVVYSHHVTTVSPSYALEIQSDQGGMGFGGILKSRQKALSGILNGIDLEVWDPETDPAITAPFSADAPEGKAKNKVALQKKMGLRVSKDTPLFCVISRLTTQKGLDLLGDLVDHIVLSGGQLALLGSGDSAIEDKFRAAAEKHPTEVSVQIGYDEPLAHFIQAGSDAIFIPSRFEPCGLTQLCAMRYGTVPIAGRVGGLNDTIIDASPAALAKSAATGLLFFDITPHNLSATIDRAFSLYKAPKIWSQMKQNCLSHPVGWEPSAKDYLNLYAGLLEV
ncbi:glycogen synthase GlgA [Litorimonas sp. WD9-15]|uniref:glycogen synthase GlgA n=1 Tax=Litorimonas sp. WD9-15 TaxID=3418716 RepID=UPI003CFECB05